MKIKEFVEQYNGYATDYLKEDFLKENLKITPYIPFVTKEAIGLLRKGGGCTDRNCGQCRGSTGSLDKAAAGNELFHRERPPLIQYALSALSFHAVQRCFPFWGADVLLQNRKGTLLPKS